MFVARFSRPFHGLDCFVILTPAINRWAIFDRPLRGLNFADFEVANPAARELRLDWDRYQSPHRALVLPQCLHLDRYRAVRGGPELQATDFDRPGCVSCQPIGHQAMLFPHQLPDGQQATASPKPRQ